MGSCKCIASRGIAVGTSAVVRYSGDVRYWECPLSEVPLYRDGMGRVSRERHKIISSNEGDIGMAKQYQWRL